MMSRPDYQILAEEIRASRPNVDGAETHEMWAMLVARLISRLAQEYKNFNADHFRKECWK